ncbi:MAG: branched-chain amino acid ABC transporter permease, partial [Microcystis panniformis]
MADFFNTYGFLIVSMIFGAILGISIYLPLMAGQLSLATPGFYALGGYVAAILSTKVFTNTSSNYPLTLVFLEMLIAG